MRRNHHDLIVVEQGARMDVQVVEIYHRHFPEVRGEGHSHRVAARHLTLRLARCLDHAQGWGRQAIERALADVREHRSSRDSSPREAMGANA